MQEDNGKEDTNRIEEATRVHTRGVGLGGGKMTEDERCKKCGHLRKFHHLEGEGIPVKYFYVCHYNYGSFDFQRCECKEKEFKGMKQKKEEKR